MHNSLAPVLDSIYLLSLTCEQFSHAIRTPLSTALGALDDLTTGHVLSAKDIREARQAAQEILDQLDALRIIAMPIEFIPREYDLAQLVEQHFTNSNLQLDILLRPLIVRGDPQLILRMLECLVRYLETHGHGPIIRTTMTANEVELQVFYRCTTQDRHSHLQKAKDYQALVESLYQIESLILRFADLLARLHNTKIGLYNSASKTFGFRIVFF